MLKLLMVQDTGETWNTSTPVNVGGSGTPSGQTRKQLQVLH